ncbi:AraC family transcriptional regulator [Dyadobacter sp. CY261]|uniref:AraC family transcriptional regulator n=1 Tax=Dyadobacter sp. CY261 TaxID=2907203 RepID=UPI001F3D37E6|nr:AraC family transcriptional regulator [Dyadobacter sp. CY261]MCF0074310.1 AraC family transcriptional regulator [Dyadobacter sp. CY261]
MTINLNPVSQAPQRRLWKLVTIPKPFFNVMKEFNIDQTLNLVSCEARELEQSSRYDGLFGIAFVTEGEGVLSFDDSSWHYDEHAIFLLSPGHHFQFKSFYRTNLLTIFFDPFRIAGAADPLNGFAGMFRAVRDLFSVPDFLRQKELRSEIDRHAVTHLVRLIESELNQLQESSRDLVTNSAALLVSLVKRNFSGRKHMETELPYNPETERVLAEVRKMVRQNEPLTIQEIAAAMNMSQYNLNKMVIKGTGETLKAIISRYRTENGKARQLDLQE